MEKIKREEENSHTVDSFFNPDKPIYSESQNLLLKRDYYSEILFNSLNNYKNKESFVIGIDGEWGDGKTSFVTMTLEKFGFNSQEQKYVLFFNPWSFSTPKELTSYFLNEIKRFLKKILGKNYSEDLNNKFLLYLNYLTIENFQTPDKFIVEENDTESLKREIDNVLRKTDFKLIVVIDDLDRLTEDETKQVFRFVKLVGDFPNIIYIIPFDKQKTIKICNVDEDYLRKILQVEIKLPPVISTEIFSILYEKLFVLFKINNVETFDFNDWNKSLSGPLRYYIKNIRDVNRIINTLNFYISNVQVKELNAHQLERIRFDALNPTFVLSVVKPAT